MITNNVTRLLTSRHIPFQAFELPPEKVSALETAQRLGVPPDQVYKTIVILPELNTKPVLAVIPATHVVDLKAIACCLNRKKVHLATQRQAEQLTGLQTGGISPLALLQRGYQVLLDSSAEMHTSIHISGGQRGLNIRLPVKALRDLTHARVCEISSPAQQPTDLNESNP